MRAGNSLSPKLYHPRSGASTDTTRQPLRPVIFLSRTTTSPPPTQSMESTSEPAPSVLTEAWLPGYDSTQFYTRTYLAPEPRALLLYCHGFSEHIARYEWAHTLCASKGITVFAFDQRGFGRTALDAAHKSKKSSYGRTNLHDQLSDIKFWLKRLSREYPGLPIFTMGHSMGAALILSFATRTSPPPDKDSVSLLAGVIPSSTLLLQFVSTSKIVRYCAEKLSVVLPNLLFDASMPNNLMSHDPKVGEALDVDPLVIQKGSLRALSDMLNNGEQLWKSEYKNWPPDLPVMFVHGNADKVTSFEAAHDFYENMPAKDKRFLVIEDGYHELVNEPNGVKEKFMEDCITWMLEHAHQANPPAGPPPSATVDLS
ncbi:lysophospholipase [Trametes elegans]|nr:lysophospholipase [Trametes elegans]